MFKKAKVILSFARLVFLKLQVLYLHVQNTLIWEHICAH